MDWYFLGAVKNYYLSQKTYAGGRKTMKALFENLFHVIQFERVMVLDDKLMVCNIDLLKIHNFFKYYIKSYNNWSRINPVNFGFENAFEVESYDNDYILSVYTKNFVKPSLTALKESIERKMPNFKKHVSNVGKLDGVKKVVSFDFEYCDTCVEGISEVGISIYYPQHDSVDNYHYLIKSNNALSKRRLNLGKEFRFGVTELVSLEKALLLLRRELLDADFIVGHDLINEFNILNISPEWSRVIDTKYCDVVLNNRDQYFSLKNILKYYGFKTAFLHNAGNDAAYVIELILKMKNQVKQSLENKEMVNGLIHC